MDTSFSVVHVEYSAYFKVYLVFLLIYPWPIIAIAFRGWRRASQLSPRLIYALTLLPLVALTTAWWGYNRLLTGLAVSGTVSQAIKAAGVAAAQVPTFLAAIAGALLAAIIFVAYARRARSGRILWVPLVVLFAIGISTSVFGWWLVRAPLHQKPFMFVWLGLGTCLIATSWSLFQILVRRVIDVSVTTAVLFAIAGVIAAIAIWNFMELLRHIAMGLRAA